MTTKANGRQNIIERTVAYALGLHSIGTSRKVPSGMVETDADKSRIRVSMSILKCDELKEIRSIDAKMRDFLRARSVPYPLKSGIYLIPTEFIREVDEEIERRKQERGTIVESLVSKIDDLREADRTSLGSLFDESKYPSREQVERAHYVETRYIALDLPSGLKTASKEVFNRERDRICQELERASETIRQVQRAQLSELVKDLVDKLAPSDGKKKILKQGGPLDRIQEFLDRYGKLNVADDSELEAIVGKAKEVLSGVDLEAVKTSDALAAKVKDGMEQVKTALAPLISDAPVRKFRKTA
jgi:hypothetical protein